MAVDQRLEWTHRNLSRTARTRHVGASIRQLVERLDSSTLAAVREIVRIVAAVVDDEFRKHCRVVLDDVGQMVVNVDHPTLVYSLRSQWLSPIRRALAAEYRLRSVRQIIFAFGTVGHVVPEVAAS